ncbi:MarR family winged helix-turn-helix transcriptional regulator [Alicyclobacillus fastidiosus]|nr:MarR family transcriptional regulator [Alicyclobacillus fastidiosus]GMA62693.1 hypothetical protein GCM10025859_31330 [Alicyclobacillus fastidiosus]
MMESHKYSVRVIEHEVAILAGISALHQDLGGIERPEYILLRQINEYGMVGVKELADEFCLDHSTISKHVAVLESQGLIKRLSLGPDDRLSLFRTTELGHEVLNKNKEMRLDKYASILKRWSNRDLQRLGELLSLLNRTLADD